MSTLDEKLKEIEEESLKPDALREFDHVPFLLATVRRLQKQLGIAKTAMNGIASLAYGRDMGPLIRSRALSALEQIKKMESEG